MGWKNLGLPYARGLGVPKDPEKARKYLTKAAEQDVPGAAEALQTLTPARAFPATALRIGCLFLMVIVAFLAMIPCAWLTLLGWPKVQMGIESLQAFLRSAGALGVWVYIFLERILIPTGLHHFV